MKLGFSGLSEDFKFGHKLKHLEVDRTIEDGSLKVVEKITRVIMIFYANLGTVFVSLTTEIEKNYLIYLFKPQCQSVC